MGFFDKTRYIRALLTLVPLGLGFIYFGGKSLMTGINDLPKSSGIIECITHTNTYFEFRNRRFSSPTISIRLKNKPEIYISPVTKYINIIDSILNKGDNVIIWFKTDRKKNEITQLEKNGRIIIPYDKASGVAWGFLIAGIIISFIAIGYLIKYPEDLLGKKSSKSK